MKDSDILVWPDGTWCNRWELAEMSHKSDDYEVIPFGTFAWDEFLDQFE